MKFTESDIQKSIIKWADMHSRCKNKEIELLYAIPNGAHVSDKNRMRLVAEGLKKGMPDLCLPVPKGRFGSLFLEVKTRDGVLSKDQKAMHEKLESFGNKVVIVRDLFNAIDAIDDYMNERYQ